MKWIFKNQKNSLLRGGENLDESFERFDFTWFGKSKAIQESQKPSNGTLRPFKKESKNWDTTQNLYIEGDNLEVLKLLQKTYYNKIKLIYIDPPYNTGNDFVYKDNYQDNLHEYLINTGQIKIEGETTKFLSSNLDTNGNFHSNWLNMIYPRLKLAKNLLSEEGVIYISIDDKEFSNLKKVCDEIFGENNFIATICQKSRGGISNDKIISENHNYHLFYAKNKENIHENRQLYGVKKTEKDFKNFNKDDNDGKGLYTLNPVSGPGGARKGNPFYSFLDVEGYYRFSKETMQKMYEEGKIVKVNNHLYQKTYLKDLKDKVKTISTWWDDVGTTSNGTTELKKLFPEYGVAIFDHPKPTSLIKLMIEYCNVQENDIVLDFFAGSGTTAHSVFKINAEDNKNIHFILVQLPQPTKEKTDAYIAGYKYITDISKERINRAGDSVVKEYGNKDLDTGFKVFKLDSSNLTKWNPDVDNLEDSLVSAADNIVEGRSSLDLVYEIMLKYGLELTLPVEEISKDIFSVAFGSLVVCLRDDVDENVIHEIFELVNGSSVSRVVFKDNGFKSDSDKTNIKENLRVHGVDEFITI